MYETHNPVEDRFGFSTSGTFRCARPSERIGTLTVCAAVLLLCFALYYVLFMQLEWFRHYSYAPANSASTLGYVYVGLSALIVIIGYAVIHYILQGVAYSYSADENRFSFVCRKTGVQKTDIFYTDVVSVDFADLYLFGIIRRGFEVTVVTRSLGSITFRYLFNKSIAENNPANTPFRIIEERLEQLQRYAAEKR